MATVKRRAKRKVSTGLSVAKTIDSYDKLRHFFFCEGFDQNTLKGIVNDYVQSVYTDPIDIADIMSHKDWVYTYNVGLVSAIYWKHQTGKPFPPDFQCYENGVKDFLDGLLQKARNSRIEQEQVKKQSKKKVVKKKSPIEALRDRLNATVLSDLDEFFEAWSRGEKEDSDDLRGGIVACLHHHDVTLSAACSSIINAYLDPMLTEYKDVAEKRCEQAIEAYSHVAAREIKRRIKVITGIKSEIETGITATRKKTDQAKAFKGKRMSASDKAKMVSSLVYEREREGLKSAHPATIIGSKGVYLYNTEKRSLTALLGGPLFVSGTTIKGFDESKSYTIKLRKPSEVLDGIISASKVKEIDQIISALTTKKGKAVGRCNKDTIILKVL